MTQHQTTDITQAVPDRLAPNADLLFKEVLCAVVRHAHALAREVDLKPDESRAAVQFLTRVGQKCDDKRQEFILLSDTLGISMLVVQLEQARRSALALADKSARLHPTEATVQGPFYCEGAPVLPLGSDIGLGLPGEPAYYSGRVTDTHRKAIAECCVDMWSGEGEGAYDMQRGGDAGMRSRARFHTAADGGYRFWSIKPTFYPVPDDGPVGDNETIVVRGTNLCDELIGKLGFVDDVHLLVTGRRPDALTSRVLDATLVAIAEHDLVPSVQASRMTLAAAPDAIQGAVAAGILGCGSVILGASEAAGRLFLQVDALAAGKALSVEAAAAEVVRELREQKQAIPGYGHPQHKARDPRVARLFAVAQEAGASMHFVRIAEAIESVLPGITGRDLRLNVSGAIPAVLLDVGFPAEALKGVPILARCAGLIGHLTEELARPIGFALSYQATREQRYTGELPSGFTPGMAV